jgi:hypothetical protein
MDVKCKTVGYWFKSSLFEIEPGEDEAINPGIYGKQLANWLAEKLHAKGYEIEIVEEDWGRCLICLRKPVRLWIGCANVATNFPNPPVVVPAKEAIVWHCFVECEIPFLKRLFGRPIDDETPKQKLALDLKSILESEPQITFVSEP